VDALPEIREIDPSEPTMAVGMSGAQSLQRTIEARGRKIDLGKVFGYQEAVELGRVLEDEGIPILLRDLEGLELPDQRPRFEVHVRVENHARAEEILHARWRELAAEEGGVSSDEDPEKCPACGARVPLEVEECPECGLVVGVGEEGAEAAP
jgi:hypothetical protein